MDQVAELGKLLENIKSLDSAAQKRVLDYYAKLVEGNAAQNLTRLIAPQDFIEGHLLDVLELEKTSWVQHEALDLGSGCGVPGLLAACVNPTERWVLAESELRKREFLQETVDSLQLSDRIRVGARGEEILRRVPLKLIVSRAVGKLSKLWIHLGPCSTWNTLVLFKGPAWTEEWNDFESAHLGELKVTAVHEYVVGAEQKQRKLIRLDRVPRGT